MENIPSVKIGIVAVSRDCFPIELSINRRKALVEAYEKKYGKEGIYECPVCIFESEIDMVKSLEDIKANGCNALCVFLGNTEGVAAVCFNVFQGLHHIDFALENTYRAFVNAFFAIFLFISFH